MRPIISIESVVGFALAWGAVWFVHSVVNGKPLSSLLVAASFVGFVLIAVLSYGTVEY
ncbi:hypothetical protein [Halorussus lipolyticus]|uniref:hypothetical protein n=1 Tax=Halorussus lipolyticus TaxID=3034024 RepID=UPI0023E7F045|nr:hypothetical protein [Halorussus sp. DT80]